MNGPEISGGGARPDQNTYSKKDASEEVISVSIVNLPSGLITFTAVPKLFEKHTRLWQSKSKRQHARVKPKEIDDLDKMMTKLGVKEIASDKKQGTDFTFSNEIFKKTSNHSVTKRVVRFARRKLRVSTVSLRRDKQMMDEENPVKEPMMKMGPEVRPRVEINEQSSSFAFDKCIGYHRVPFLSLLGTELLTRGLHVNELKISHQCIVAMPEYNHMSYEEIRNEDYISGQNNPTYASNNEPKFMPVIGIDKVKSFGADRELVTRNNCISAMPEYEEYSFEELRLEHYMPGVAWKDRNRLSLSDKEIQQLPISIDSEVYIFLNLSGLNERQKGKVRFIGHLPDKPLSEIHVGVELDHAVGTGNGCYKKVRLFRTDKLCAEIIPLDAALPVYLFDNGTAETQAKDTTSTSESLPGSDKANKCSVCWVNPVNMFFQPCGHVCCCERCSKPMKDCPICRKRIIAKHKAYLT